MGMLCRRIHARPDRDDGFTVIEMVVALLIIGIVAAGFLGVTVSTLKSARWHEQVSKANSLAQDRLEKIVTQPWASIGLYAADPGYTATVGGEPTVSLTASPRKASVPLPVDTTTMSGVTYTVNTSITWRDDVSDNVPATAAGVDSDGTTQDVKHVTVNVTWTTQNHPGTVTLEDLRAPTATEVTPVVTTAAMTVIVNAPGTQQLTTAGMLNSAMTVTATTSKTASSATLKFATRAGVQSVSMTSGSGGTSWTTVLPTTTGPFDTGSTTFSVVAASSSGQTTGKTDVLLAVGTGGSATLSVSAAPSQQLSTIGTLSQAVAITATGSTNISSATVSFPTATGTLTRTMAGSGSTFSYTVPVDSTTYNTGTETFTIAVTFTDNTTRTGLVSIQLLTASLPPDVTALVVNSPFTTGGTTQGFCTDLSYQLHSTTTVDATVSNVATTDTVRLTAPALTTLEFTMSWLRTNADGSMVFRYTTPAGQQFPNATSIVLKTYATKTMAGSQYRDDFVTSPAVPIQVQKFRSACV
jgi:prepilin-type N-terminal cleavage/methylation domain-containing protein